MDIVGLANITQHSHAGVFQGEGSSLLITDRCPAIRFARFRDGRLEIRQLGNIERKRTLVPMIPPAADHGRQVVLVVFHIVLGVGFSLVPDRSADGIGDQRMHHRIEQC